MKSGFISIIGKPNAGKSTLLNKIFNNKISIVSDKPQTTRNSVLGVYNKEDLQIVFVDTPGIHDAKTSLGNYMNKVSYNEAYGCDIIYYLLDCKKGFNSDDNEILDKIFSYNIPVFLLLNKIDECSKNDIITRLSYGDSHYKFSEFIPISALKGENIDTLMDVTSSYLKEGPMYYPKDYLTNLSNKQKVSEIIRERILKNVDKEIPHLIAVSIDEYNESESKVIIEACITVNKDSHKGIILGKNGSMLKKINIESCSELKDILKKKIVLSLFVKVCEDWINDEKRMFELGYFINKND